MSAIPTDVRHAVRSLRRAPGFTAVAILTLALGIGASSAIFSVVRGVLLRPLPFTAPEQLVRVFTTARGDTRKYSSPPNFAALRERRDVFTGVAAYDFSTPTLTDAGEPRKLESAQVTPGFFEVLGVLPARGRTFREADALAGGEAAVVIGHAFWQQDLGGDPAVVGRTLVLDGVRRTVVGVMPPAFDFPEGRQLWTPLEADETYAATSATERGSNWLWLVARLRPGATVERAQAAADALARRLEADFPASQRGVGFAVVGLRDEIVGEVRTPLVLLFGAVGVLLLIACANVAGLLLARAATRQEELAVRVALGAGRQRLVRQLLTESLLLAVAGGAVGLLVAVWGADALVAARPPGMPRLDDVRVDGTVVAFAAAAVLAATLLVGLVPALLAARGAVAQALRAGGRGGQGTRGSQRLRGGLVVGQTALAVVLLAGAGLLGRSFLGLVAVDPGFRPAGVAAFPVELPETAYTDTSAVRGFYAALTERLAALPDVESAAAVYRLPLASSGIAVGFAVEGREPMPGEELRLELRSATPDYFRAMGIPVRAGRGIAAGDHEAAPRVAVLNEAAARRYFGGADPVGQQLRFRSGQVGDEPVTVVGIVGGVRHYALDRSPEPEVYFPHAQVPLARMTVVVRAACRARQRDCDPIALTRGVREVVGGLDARVPVPALRTLEEIVADSVARPRFLATLLALLAGGALALTAVGIFGLLSFTVAQRRREIGIRIALGARPPAVLRRVLAQAMALVVAGLAIGLAGALLLGRLVTGLLYGVRPTDPVTLVAVALLLGVTGALAALVPARRAAAVEPATALRGS